MQIEPTGILTGFNFPGVSQSGIDCTDSDCWGRQGPENICCYSAEDCPNPNSSICSRNRCQENSCDNNLDDDEDGLTDCADPDCNQKICADVTGEKHFCFNSQCIMKPEAPTAPTEMIIKPKLLPVYGDVLKTLNKCAVRTGQADSCAGICAANEKGFPTKTENNLIVRCSCCGGTQTATQTASQQGMPAAIQTGPTETSCTNGEDDDGDGFTDCDDSDCLTNQYC